MAQLSNERDALADLSAKAPDSDWRCCLYPVDKVKSPKETFHCRPGVHFMAYTSDFKFCLLAITSEAAEQLGKDAQLEWTYHKSEVARPLQLVTSVHGEIEAKKKTLEIFRVSAIRGIEKYGRQLAAVYQSQEQFEVVRLQIEGSVLISDILGSPEDAQELFAQLVIQVCLYLEDALDYVRTTTVGQIISNCQRVVKTDLGIRDEAGEKTKLLQLALVRRIFEMAVGRQAERLPWISTPPLDHKAVTSLQLLGSIFGIPEAPIGKAFEVETMLSLLSRCVAFQGKLPTVKDLELRARGLQENVLNLPSLDLPAPSVMNLSYLESLQFRTFRLEVELYIPSLANNVCSTDMFFCWRSGHAPPLDLVMYARSPEGRARLLQPHLESLRGKADAGRLAISLLVMHWYFHLTGAGLCHAAETSTGVDCLTNFHSLLYDEAVYSAQWVLRKQLRALELVLKRREDVFPGLSAFVRKCGTWDGVLDDDVDPVLAHFWELTLQGQTSRVAFHSALIQSVPFSSRLDT